MTIRSIIKRVVTVTGATTALVLAGSTAASAHHCYIPMYHLNGPASANWFVATAELGALDIVGFETGCDEQRDAGYAALEEAGLPVAIKISNKKVIGEGSSNPNLGNGKGLEHLGTSTLAEEMLMTYIAAASAVACPAG